MTDSVRNARAYALKLLSYRSRSEREMYERLRDKGFSQEVLTSAVSDLRQSGLIDDRALAEDVKRQALQDKLLSYEGTRKFLIKRGVRKEVIEESIVYDEAGELENARKIIARKLRYRNGSMTVKDRSRLWNFLVRRGFPFHIVDRALRQSGSDREDDI